MNPYHDEEGKFTTAEDAAFAMPKALTGGENKAKFFDSLASLQTSEAASSTDYWPADADTPPQPDEPDWDRKDFNYSESNREWFERFPANDPGSEPLMDAAGRAADIDALHRALDPVGVNDEEERVDAKIAIQFDLQDRLRAIDNTSSGEWLKLNGVEWRDIPEEDQGQWVREQIDSWARTASGDERAVALQMAVKEEFGLLSTATDHLQSDWIDAQEGVYKEEGQMMRALARAQYESTQEFLKEHDIETVTLVRGSPNLSRRTPFVDGIGDVRLQPVSSFSNDVATAVSFADNHRNSAVHVVRVPREQVFSTARTGFGALLEHEVTILGGPVRAMTITRGKNEPTSNFEERVNRWISDTYRPRPKRG